MKKLNLGCGENWKDYPGYEGLDIINYGQRFVCSILKKNFISYNYDEVMANHFLEHFSQDELRTIFTKVHRILKPGGLFKFVVPHMDKQKSWVLSHKTYWNETVCSWLGEKEARDTYGFGSWKVKEAVVNERKDIHVKLIKV